MTALTHLSRIGFPTIINWTNSFSFYGLLGGIFHFNYNYNRNNCKQIVETLIRRRVLRRLIWVCTVYLRSLKRTLGLHELSIFFDLMST